VGFVLVGQKSQDKEKEKAADCNDLKTKSKLYQAGTASYHSPNAGFSVKNVALSFLSI
jgi:hypothetical protein